jgi:hypothetical protein
MQPFLFPLGLVGIGFPGIGIKFSDQYGINTCRYTCLGLVFDRGIYRGGYYCEIGPVFEQ